MSKLNAIVIATTLLFAATAQADDGAARAAQELTAQAMRSEGLEHLIPAPRRDSLPALAGAKAGKPVQQAEQAPKLKPAATGQTALNRAAVIAELQRARQAGELDHAFAEIGYQPLPIARGSDGTRFAAAGQRR